MYIALAILALAIFAGIVFFCFKNAVRIVLIIMVCFMGYVGWHIYLKDKGINPNKAVASLTESLSSASEKALDTAKEKASEVADEATEKAKEKASDATEKAKKSIKEKVNKAL